jgi:hypothetical protein
MHTVNAKVFSLEEGGSAVQVAYRAGEWGMPSGGELFINPFNPLPADAVVLSYQLFFSRGMDWKRGGKLPGVCIGERSGDCATGGKWKPMAGSVRMMWRRAGRAIGYIYRPTSAGALDAQGSDYRRVAAGTKGYGETVFCEADGGLVLQSGVWNNVSMLVELGEPGTANGSVAFSVNGETRSVRGILFRTSNAIQIVSANVLTFFGGGDASWAAPANASARFRNFAFNASP